MPKWAIAWTIACAIIGQVMGARLERGRLQQEQLLPGGNAAAAASTTTSSGHASAGSAPAARSCQADATWQHNEGSWRQSFLIPALG